MVQIHTFCLNMVYVQICVFIVQVVHVLVVYVYSSIFYSSICI